MHVSDREGTVSGGAESSHLNQVLLAQGARRHGRDESAASGHKVDVRGPPDEAAARSTVQVREARPHGMGRKDFSLDLFLLQLMFDA